MVEGPAFGEGAGAPASGAAAGGGRQVGAEHLPQRAAETVAVRPHVGHQVPPLGPNRSVLTCRGSIPWLVSRSAMLSTKPVGPQTKQAAPASCGPASEERRVGKEGRS